MVTDVGTGVKVTDTFTQVTAQDFRFENVKIGIDASSGGSGHFTLLDSTATNTSILILAATTTTLQGSMVLENIAVDQFVAAVSDHYVTLKKLHPNNLLIYPYRQ